jgi:hypothetical protein
MMFDPNYDPYDHIQRLDDLVNQLIAANNHCQQALLELTDQHRILIAQLKQQRDQIRDLKRRLELESAKTYFNSHNSQGQH